MSADYLGFSSDSDKVGVIRIVHESFEKASKQKRRGDRYCAMVTIDVKNALNSASWEVPDYRFQILKLLPDQNLGVVYKRKTEVNAS